MRKRFFVAAVVAVLSVFAFVACFGQSRLEKLVKEINDQCPIKAGELGEVTGAEVKEEGAVFTLMVDETVFNIDALNSNPDIIRQSLLESLKNPSDEVKALVDELKLCNSSLTYIYKGKTSGKTTSVTITSDEIKNASKMSTSDQDPEALLNAQIAVTNVQLPLQIDEATIMTRLEREGNCVVYYYEVDETLVDFDYLEENASSVEEMLTMQLQQQKYDVGSATFIRACKENNTNIVYRYIGTNTGRTLSFTVNIDNV